MIAGRRRRRTSYGRARAVIAGALLLGSASGAVADAYDLETGDYLTAEEYKKLSKDEAVEYCQRLAQEIDIQNDNAASASSMIADLDAEIAELSARLAEAKAANDLLASEVAELEGDRKEPTYLPSSGHSSSYEVVAGDYLIKIAEDARIYGDRRQWERIFRANRDKIENPNLIYPGQILVIPR